MDIARPDQKRKKRIRLIMTIAVVAIVIVGLTVLLHGMKPAAPTMDGSTAYADSVKRGNMMIEVHGLGTLVPEDIRWIAAQSSAKIDKILIRSGATVRPDSVILELSDPQLQNDATSAEFVYKQSLADLDNAKATVNQNRAQLQVEEAGIEGTYNVDSLIAKLKQEEQEQGLGNKMDAETTRMKAEQDDMQLKMEKQKLMVFEDSSKAQIASQEAKVEAARALYDLKKSQLEALHVKAGLNGVVQCVCTAPGTDVAVGQQVTPGTNLARVADPSKLKATVQVPETQAKDVVLNEKATVDTRNGIAKGHVTRIDAAPINGTVGVDISFDEPLPNGARPDLSVDGTVEISNMTNVLFVSRPVHCEQNSDCGLFKVNADGTEGTRVQVKLGKGSVNTMEVLGGLKEGDMVILNDMSNYDNVDRVQFSPRVQAH
jgi:HlyD family secretion protein